MIEIEIGEIAMSVMIGEQAAIGIGDIMTVIVIGGLGRGVGVRVLEVEVGAADVIIGRGNR